MHSRKTIYALLSNRSDLCLKQFIIKSGSSLLTHMQTGLWRIGKGYSGQMKQKSTELGQMARCIPGNLGVNQSLIGQPHCYELFTFSLSFFTILSLSFILSSKPYFTSPLPRPLLAFSSFPSYMLLPRFLHAFASFHFYIYLSPFPI